MKYTKEYFENNKKIIEENCENFIYELDGHQIILLKLIIKSSQ